ncbi:MAG: protein kinase, partial [Chlamydiota bacterium]|nr:protein kinase [Chlamydiota bacterium]
MGDYLGDYELLEVLGEGSLGKSYLARHRFLNHQVVIKAFCEGLSCQDGFIERFEEGIQNLTSIDHTHIVKTENVSCSGGRYFLVNKAIVDCFGKSSNLMEYVTENQETMNEEWILDILSQLATALSAIHSHQVANQPLAHRNIKLTNLLLGHGPKGLHLYVSDVGLGMILGEDQILERLYKGLSHQSSLTSSPQHAQFLQRYFFLAPEQKVIRRWGITPQADIYAFGVLTYFLLTQSFPEGAFPLPSSYNDAHRINWDRLIRESMHPNPLKRPSNILSWFK